MKENIKCMLISCLLACTGLHCKKETDAPDPNATGISAKIDGQWRTFYCQPFARQWGNYNYSYIIEGYEGSTSGHKIQIAFDTPTPLTPGTYSSSANNGVLVRVFYGTELNFGYSSWESTDTPANGRKVESVNITELNSTGIKGSFTCNLFSNMYFVTSKPKILVSGNFNVKF